MRSANKQIFVFRLSLSAVTLVSACMVFAGPSNAKPRPKNHRDQLDLAAIESGVANRLSAQHIPGAALVIVKDGKVIDLKCYGYRDFAHLLEVTPETPFCIGTCTKAFTAMAAEIAVDDGSLSLEDSPRKYLPEFKLSDPASDASVTMRDFLSNSSGLNEKNLRILQKNLRTYEASNSPSRILHVISGVRPTAKPGEKVQHSNLGYCVAGWAVAAAEQTTFEKLLADRIFGPLQMTDSRLIRSNPSTEDVRSYILDRNAQPQQHDDPVTALLTPASGIVSSPRDMGKWLALLTSGGEFDGKRLVSKRGFEELLAQGGDSRGRDSFRFGWDSSKLGKEKIVNRIGAETGYAASVTFLPDHHVGVVLLTNLQASSHEVAEDLPKWVLSQLVAAE